MSYYFRLQASRLHRWSENFGLPLLFVLLLAAVAFLLGSTMIFSKLDQANWVYLLVAYAIIDIGRAKGMDKRLRMIYTSAEYHKIRLVETSLAALPFTLFALYQREGYLAMGILGVGLLTVFVYRRRTTLPIIPTPFKRWAYEFVIGCRKYFFLILLLYLLMGKAVQVGNANLGLVCMGFLSLLSASFYLPLEPVRIVWQHNMRPTQFLNRKIVLALLSHFVYLVPVIVALLFFFPTFSWPIFGIMVMGSLVVVTIILAKYSAYPKDIGVLQSFIIAFSISIPVVLPVVWWLFYKQSRRQLQMIL